MKKNQISFILVIIIASLQLIGCNAFNKATETMIKVLEVTPKTQLKVNNINGNISVEIWNESKVKVDIEKFTNFGRKELNKVDVQIETVNDILTINSIVREPNTQVTVNYVIKVPTTIFVSSLKTKNGNLSIKKTKGDLLVQTTNGSIIADKIDGWLKAYTVNGNVKTSGGMGIAEIQTTNGSIEADILNIPQEGSSIRTSNAHIRLHLSNIIGLYLDLATTNGTVKVNGFASEIISSDETHYKAKIREGGKTLSAFTTNGNIDVIK